MSAYRRRRSRGFSLVELSVVVVVIGILSALAVVGYSRYRSSSRMAEAKNMLSMIRAEQESYKTERGLYAAVSTDADAFYPAATPGKFATAWGGPCSNCVDASGWSKLPIVPSGPVMYGYSTVAGIGAEISASFKTTPSFGPAPPPPADPPCGAIAPSQPFFVTKAQGDVDGDGVASTILALSCSNELILTNEGE